MRIREATLDDIPGMHYVRIAVTENVLSDPARITAADYRDMLADRGKGWVCTVGKQVVGFAIVDLVGRNIWALFVLPGYERQGIGGRLFVTMMNAAFAVDGVESLWLSTAPDTRAEQFYLNMGWRNTGMLPGGEIRFNIDKKAWLSFPVPEKYV